MATGEAIALAQVLWDYHHMNQPVLPSDGILVLGSHDVRVAERGAELFMQGLAPWIVMSGGLGNLTQGRWAEPEADIFARIARARGVPADTIMIENRSANTGENIDFTRNLLRMRGLDPGRLLVVQKPYMERRTYATFKKRWPEKDFSVTSPCISFVDYPNAEIPLDDVIHIMVGDLQRILLYPARGFQIEQPVPEQVHSAQAELIRMRYTRHLIEK